MKKEIGLFLVLGIIALSIGVASCGQQNSDTTTTTTSTTLPGGISSIRGSLSSGTVSSGIRTSGTRTIQAFAAGSLAGYTVTAVGKDTGAIYFSDTTDSAGNFTVSNLPSHESFYLEVLDDNNQLVAPVTFGTASGKAVMAISASSESIGSVDLGAVVLDNGKGVAVPTAAPTANLDTSASVDPAAGETLVPKGADNLGKGSATQIASGTYNNSVADGDKDGLPNILDADNNGDLIADEFDGLYTNEVFSSIPPNYYAYAFTNLKVDWGQRDSFNHNYDTFSIALGVVPNAKGGFTPKTIASCKLVSGPSWITKAYSIVGATRTLWSASSYDIPKKSGMDMYEVQLSGSPPAATLKPGIDVTAGDALRLQVTYTDGSSEESVKMINFVFTDIPRVVAYKIGSSPWQEGAINFPTNASTSEVTLRWTRPLDEASREVIGGRYTFEYNSSHSGAIETEVISRDAGTASSLEAAVNYVTLPDYGFDDVAGHQEFMLGVCIRSVASDNSAENIRFQKAW